MALTSLEAVDLLRFADLIAERIASAEAELSKKRGLEREKQWLAAAAELLDEARAPGRGLIDRARMLPELTELREELAGSVQNAWVDALEKLLAGITFHISGRAPIIEALFPHQKFPPLRRAPHEVAAKFQADLEKRAKGSYVNRMLSSEDYAFATPVLELIRKSWADYDACFSGGSMSEEEAAPIREALATAVEGLELPLRQARLLAEAALASVAGAFEASGIGAKPRKRAGRAAPETTALAGAEDAASIDVSPDAAAEPDETKVDAPEEAPETAAHPEMTAPADATAPAEKPAKKKRAPRAAKAEKPEADAQS